MPIRFMIDSPNGAAAALELIQFVETLKVALSSGVPTPKVIGKPEPKKDAPAPVVPAAPVTPTPPAVTAPAAPTSPAQEESTPAADTPPAVAPEKPKRASRKKKAEPETPPVPPVVQPAEPAPDAVQKAAEEKTATTAPKEGEKPTLAHAQNLILELSTKKGMDKAREIIKSYGVERVRELSEDKFEAFCADVNKALAS